MFSAAVQPRAAVAHSATSTRRGGRTRTPAPSAPGARSRHPPSRARFDGTLAAVPAAVPVATEGEAVCDLDDVKCSWEQLEREVAPKAKA